MSFPDPLLLVILLTSGDSAEEVDSSSFRQAAREVLAWPVADEAPLSVRGCGTDGAMGLDRVLDASVLVRMPGSLGSGVVISPDGFIWTAAHVVRVGTPTVVFRSGLTLSARIVRISEEQDIALLRVSGSGYTCVPLALEPPDPGSPLLVVGAPTSATLVWSVTRGTMVGSGTVGGVPFLQVDAHLVPGNSGGPIVDDSGKLQGVVSWKLLEGDRLGFGVPAQAATQALGITWSDVSGTDTRD